MATPACDEVRRAPPGERKQEKSPPLAENSASPENRGPPPESTTARKTLRAFGYDVLSVREEKAWGMLYAGVCGLVVLNAIKVPFLLPKWKRFLGAPYLPTTERAVDALFNRVLDVPLGSSSSSSPRLLDFGSGDGRIVLEAARRGYRAVGYEINPYLWFYSVLRRRFALSAEERSRCELRLGNIWNTKKKRQQGNVDEAEKYDVITVYGRPGDSVMERVARFVRDENPRYVVSNEFPLPGFERELVKDVDGLKLYALGGEGGAAGACARGAVPPRVPASSLRSVGGADATLSATLSDGIRKIRSTTEKADVTITSWSRTGIRGLHRRPERLGADVERELLRRGQQRQETLLVAAKQPPFVDPRMNVRRFSGVGSEIQRTWSGNNSSSNTTENCTCTSNSSNGSNGSNSSCSCNATDAGGGGGTTTPATEEEGMNLKTIIQSLLIIGGVLLGLLVLGCILLCLCRQPASDAQVIQHSTTYTGPVNVDEELYTDDEDVVDRTRRKKTEKKQKKEKKDAQKEIVAEAIL
eukprot:g907.t1